MTEIRKMKNSIGKVEKSIDLDLQELDIEGFFRNVVEQLRRLPQDTRINVMVRITNILHRIRNGGD